MGGKPNKGPKLYPTRKDSKSRRDSSRKWKEFLDNKKVPKDGVPPEDPWAKFGWPHVQMCCLFQATVPILYECSSLVVEFYLALWWKLSFLEALKNEENWAEAMFDFPPEGETELELRRGDKMLVITKVDEWWYGRNHRTGLEGYFPGY